MVNADLSQQNAWEHREQWTGKVGHILQVEEMGDDDEKWLKFTPAPGKMFKYPDTGSINVAKLELVNQRTLVALISHSEGNSVLLGLADFASYCSLLVKPV